MSKKKLIVGITIPGSVNLLRGQLKYFTNIGYDTYLLTNQDDVWSLPFCEEEGCTPLDVNIKREISFIQDIKTLLAIIRIFKTIKPDIVNLGTPKMGFLGILAAKICNVPKRIYTCRGFRYESEKGFMRIALRFMEKMAGKCATKIICISPSLRDYAIEDKVFQPSKCVVINKGSSNGINLKKYDINSIDKVLKGKLKERLNINNEFVFGFLGRLRDDKGIEMLFEAYKKIYELYPNTRLLVVGNWDIPHVKNKALIPEMQNHKGVILPGRTNEVALYMSVMDVFVMPTWREGFGNVFLEAAALQIPVIGSNVTGSKSAVCENFNGLLVDPHSVDDIYLAMKKLYEDSALRECFVKNSSAWVQNFKPEIIWNGMDELYNKY